jgi:hypothetical protein
VQAALKQLQEDKLSQARIAAGIRWDIYSEIPSRYLTARVKAREAQRTIIKIRDPFSSQIVDSTQRIGEAFTNFYQDLFSCRVDNSDLHHSLLQQWPVELPPETLREVGNPFSEEEIRAAIKAIHPDKARDLIASLGGSTSFILTP